MCWRPKCCTSVPSRESQLNNEQYVSVWLDERGAELLFNPVILVMSHTPCLQLLGAQQPQRPAEGWTTSRLPHRPQLCSQPEQSRKWLSHRNIQSHTKKNKKKKRLQHCGCKFFLLHVRSLPAVNPHWEIISWENVVLWLCLLAIHYNYSGNIIISLDT